VSELLLQVEDLRTQFRTEEGLVKAVDGVDLELKRGQVLGIVGESGSGKSVTCLSIMGLIPSPPGSVQSKRIDFEGTSLTDLSGEALRNIRGNRISMIFQDPMTSLNPYLKISRQLTEVLETHKGMSNTEARHRAINMLEKVGIPDALRRIDEYPHQFSGGMRQRVMIAMALLCEPVLLIADEPTTALDVTIQAQILDLIKALKDDTGTAIILITHDLGVVAGMADDVAIMYAGRIVEFGSCEDVFANPRHPYTRGLLGSLPRMDSDASEDLVAIEGRPPDLANMPNGCPFEPRCAERRDGCADEYPPTRTPAEGRFYRCVIDREGEGDGEGAES
jgi:oligopeptide transport system ATP-binding protein